MASQTHKNARHNKTKPYISTETSLEDGTRGDSTGKIKLVSSQKRPGAGDFIDFQHLYAHTHEAPRPGQARDLENLSKQKTDKAKDSMYRPNDEVSDEETITSPPKNNNRVIQTTTSLSGSCIKAVKVSRFSRIHQPTKDKMIKLTSHRRKYRGR